MPDHDDHHTPRCNKLKEAIERLARQIKMAGLQREERREMREAEPFALTAE